MIGQFRFASPAPTDAVSVNMRWSNSVAVATVHASDDVLGMARDAGYTVVSADEPLILPLALAYGVALALLTEHALCLSGDISVWQEEWGRLNRAN